ncbi:MAG: transcriptional regulator, partial [Nocardioides sp.]
MTTPREELRGQRVDAVRAWTAFVEQADPGPDGGQTPVRPEILRSWQRSGVAITPDVSEAPMADESDTRAFWEESPLQVAVHRLEDELRRTADDGDLVLAVTDADTRILWTYGGRVMRRKAESVNFVAGGRWGESHVGTNALALANHDDRPSMVFSAEHYAPIVHNWVCWAAPVHDPATGLQLGVIDLSTTWDRTHPIGLATARMMARLIENALPAAGAASAPPALVGHSFNTGLDLHLLGRVEAVLDGQRLLLTRRQGEILALLALHPEGLALEQLHTLLYGDHAVTFSTLKAEISHLRSALGGQLASRPYRLMMPVDTDVDTVLDLLRAGEVEAAVGAFGGELMPGTSSP